ncbi:uncharacterized protein LOC117239453 isoform X2 [Bombus vosnesenskii]|uniref:Uncharacterized protein LOC117239453 isoform X2 n=1 Tax=Bombus vosnesenskii TaxID=207650 RepID=A0A6J3L6L6_9HYME|nr:uncharacterized protein LOC117239453 isoform X2 [Bombus vosnesenskii]
MTTFTYPRIFPVAVLTVSVVSDSVFHKYSLKIGSRLLETALALMYIFQCYDWLPQYLLPSIPSYIMFCKVGCIQTSLTYKLAVIPCVLRIWTHNLSSHIHFLLR